MNSSKIQKVSAREVLDSRGNPTIEAVIKVARHTFSAIVPSGASTGIHEAKELRDGTKRYQGKGVQRAVKNVNTVIAKKIKGMDCTQQSSVDEVLLSSDGTPQKEKLGGNALLSVSLGVARAGAAVSHTSLSSHLASLAKNKQMMLPYPFLNVLNGAKHAGMEHDVQEHMIVPVKGKSFSELLMKSTEVYQVLKSMLKKKFGARATLVGDEGGFVAPLKSVEERLTLMMKAIEQAGYGNEFKLALDCAASEYYEKGKYRLGKKKFDTGKLSAYYHKLIEQFPLISIEDPFAEDDWQAWSSFMAEKPKAQVVGDDLLVTNPERIKRAIDEKACDALLLKVNQIGTLSEAMAAAKAAKTAGWKVMVSHRSGESEDAFIADLVVGLGTGQSKFGAPARSDRTAKYNQLLRIEDELGRRAKLPKKVI